MQVWIKIRKSFTIFKMRADKIHSHSNDSSTNHAELKQTVVLLSRSQAHQWCTRFANVNNPRQFDLSQLSWWIEAHN